MNILLLGDTQLFGPGLSAGKRYAGQLARRLRADGYALQVDQYGPLALQEAGTLLARLPLHQYDFILLQLGASELDHLEASAAEGGESATYPKQLAAWIRRRWQQVRLRLGQHRTTPLPMLRHQLATLLMLVQPYRSHTLLLSPLPRPQRSFMQKLVRQVFIEEARLWDVASLDTSALLCHDNLLFTPDDRPHLNELAHELLGSELHTQVLERVAPPSPSWRPPSAS